MERLVTDIYGLRVESFVAEKSGTTGEYGLDAPALTIRLEGLPDGPASLIVGRRDREENEEGTPHEFAYLTADPDDWIYTARWTLVEGLFVGADELRAKGAPEASGGGTE